MSMKGLYVSIIGCVLYMQYQSKSWFDSWGGSQGALPPPPLYETLVMYVYPFGVLTYACIPSCE